MAERASLFEGVQIGLESVPGGSVAADKKLLALSIQPSVKADISTFRPMGVKYPTLAALGKEWVEASLEGQMTYSEIIYPLASIIGGGSTGTLLGGGSSGSAYEWTFTGGSAPDTPQTFTVEQGTATVRAARFSYGIVSSLSMDFTRNETSLSGSMFGTALVDGITITPNPTAIELKPVLATDVDVYLDNSYTQLGTTKLLRAMQVSWELSDRWGQLWAINSTQPSYSAVVETEPKLTVKLRLEADNVGMGLLSTMRTGDTKYLRILATSEPIYSTYKYRLQIDTAVKIAEVSEFSDDDGIFQIEWTFNGVYDGIWGKAFEIKVVNRQATL